MFYDVAHFYNEFSSSKKPWVSTFETKLPYLDDMQHLDNREREKWSIKP